MGQAHYCTECLQGRRQGVWAEMRGYGGCHEGSQVREQVTQRDWAIWEDLESVGKRDDPSLSTELE